MGRGRKKIDLTGQKFGRLTVLEDSGERSGSSAVWLCKCDCGNLKKVSGASLKTGNTKSCGCLLKENVYRPSKKDITGLRFGRLLALERAGSNDNRESIWKCKCDCGKIHYANIGGLTSGNTKSCGCLLNTKSQKTDIGKKYGMLTAIRATDQRIRGNVVWECRCDCGNIVYRPLSSLKSGNTQSCGCMKRNNHLAGQRFGMLVVLSDDGRRSYGNILWKCQCDCGNITYSMASDLKNGSKKSCGCMQGQKKVNIEGQKFGKLTVIRYEGKNRNGAYIWECKCDCGNIVYSTTSELRSGSKKSCGCLQDQKKVNIEGQKFGKLTAIKSTGLKQYGLMLWECRCECGNTTYVSLSNLQTGNTKSCGCGRRNKSEKHDKNNLKGQKFGKLTVIGYSGKKQRSYKIWNCACECGNFTTATTGALTSGDKRSCGCLRREPHNRYASSLIGKRFGNLIVLSDTGERSKDGRAYMECRCDCGNMTKVLISNLTRNHTTSCGCAKKSGGKYLGEGRKKNMVHGTNVARLEGISEGKLSKRNKTGYTGVCLNSRSGKYMAYIRFQGTKYDLGQNYDTIEEATRARKEAEKKLHGSFLEWYKEKSKKDR